MNVIASGYRSSSKGYYENVIKYKIDEEKQDKIARVGRKLPRANFSFGLKASLKLFAEICTDELLTRLSKVVAGLFAPASFQLVCLRTQAGRSVLCRTLPGIDDTFRNKNSLKQQRTFFFDNCVKGDVEEDFEVNIIDHKDAKDSSIGLDSQRFCPRIGIK
ncbi:hypothetical protein V1477_000548, partial [Vespula maculifrons]